MHEKLQNKAAWHADAKAPHLEVGDAPYTQPGQYEIVVQNHAVAINPIDWIVKQLGTGFVFQWLKYPMVMGFDVAGEVVEVGPGVTRFKPGDRVLGLTAGHDEAINRYAEAGFQLYTILREHMASPIPEELSFEAACAIPLGTSTAACGLYQKDQLNLELPSLNPQPKDKTLLIWGGSSSVGSNAIQLATASGYEVFTTCSPRNFDLVKRLGAAQAFDYNSKTCVTDIIAALKNKKIAGCLSIGDGSVDACMDVLCGSKGNKFIAVATKSKLTDPSESFATVKMMKDYMAFHSSLYLNAKVRGISYKLIYANTLVHDGVGKAIFTDFLPDALSQKRFVVTPEPMVVGHGLEYIDKAYEIQRKGVSAKKVVVTL